MWLRRCQYSSRECVADRDAYLWKPSSLMKAPRWTWFSWRVLVTASFVWWVIPGRRSGHLVVGGGEGRGKSASRLLFAMTVSDASVDFCCVCAMKCH